MTATEQVRCDLALRMSSFPLIETKPQCEVIRIDAVKNLLTRREFVADLRRFAAEPVALTGWGEL